MKIRDCFRRIAQDHLEATEAFAPHWELNTLQGGIQGGQWVVPRVIVKKARDLGSRKLLAYFRALQILGYPAELMHRRALASTSVASHY
jgi:hypothetical protein